MSNVAAITNWISAHSLPFPPDSPDSLARAVGPFLATFPTVEILALGEALHGGESILEFRNLLFRHLAQSHDFTAIAIESSLPRARLVQSYVTASPDSPASYDAIREPGFSHGFGRLETTRELIEWMRHHNAAHPDRPLQFYGVDSPTEMVGTDSPRVLLHVALDYLATVHSNTSDRRGRIDDLLGPDAPWENPAASFDPAQSIGLSPAARALRAETEDLITDLQLLRPSLSAPAEIARHAEALQHARVARHMLTYHAALATDSPDRIARLLGIRDLIFADNLTYALARERARNPRARILAFAHNSHLQRGITRWQLGPHALAWYPAGAHLHAALGPRYVNVATAVVASEENGIDPPAPGTFEHLLAAAPGPARLLSTHPARALPPETFASLAPRSASTKNSTYFPLTPQVIANFDALLTFDSTPYSRGGPPLQQLPAAAQ